jgi:hypothetical protein
METRWKGFIKRHKKGVCPCCRKKGERRGEERRGERRKKEKSKYVHIINMM